MRPWVWIVWHLENEAVRPRVKAEGQTLASQNARLLALSTNQAPSREQVRIVEVDTWTQPSRMDCRTGTACSSSVVMQASKAGTDMNLPSRYLRLQGVPTPTQSASRGSVHLLLPYSSPIRSYGSSVGVTSVTTADRDCRGKGSVPVMVATCIT